MAKPKKKKFPQIVQIAFQPNTGDLYALDAKGDIWRRDTRNTNTAWYRQLGREDVTKS